VRDHLWFEGINWEHVLAKKYKPPVVPHIDPQYVTVNFDPQEDEKFSSMTKASSMPGTGAAQGGNNNNNGGIFMRRQLLRFVPSAVARAAVNVMEMSIGGAQQDTAASSETEDELTAMFKSFAFEKEEIPERQIPLQHLSSTRISTQSSVPLSGVYEDGEAISATPGTRFIEVTQVDALEEFEALWGDNDRESTAASEDVNE